MSIPNPEPTVETYENYLNGNKEADITYLAFAKAFDIVYRRTFLRKIKDLGIGRKSKSIETQFFNKSQRLMAIGHFSTVKTNVTRVSSWTFVVPNYDWGQ